MTRIIQRWYISIILIPIAVNLFTNTVSWCTIINNSSTTILVLSIILNIILIWEFFIYVRQNKKKNDGFENDKTILTKLIATLNLNENETILKSTNHADSIDYNYVKDFKEFLAQTNRLENHINDKFLNQKLSDFRQALNNYLNFVAKNMLTHTDDDFKTISLPPELKDRDYDLYMKRMKELDDSADNAYENLKQLMITLRQKNIV